MHARHRSGAVSVVRFALTCLSMTVSKSTASSAKPPIGLQLCHDASRSACLVAIRLLLLQVQRFDDRGRLRLGRAVTSRVNLDRSHARVAGLSSRPSLLLAPTGCCSQVTKRVGRQQAPPPAVSASASASAWPRGCSRRRTSRLRSPPSLSPWPLPTLEAPPLEMPPRQPHPPDQLRWRVRRPRPPSSGCMRTPSTSWGTRTRSSATSGCARTAAAALPPLLVWPQALEAPPRRRHPEPLSGRPICPDARAPPAVRLGAPPAPHRGARRVRAAIRASTSAAAARRVCPAGERSRPRRRHWRAPTRCSPRWPAAPPSRRTAGCPAHGRRLGRAPGRGQALQVSARRRQPPDRQ